MDNSTNNTTYETLPGYTYCLHTTVPRTVTAEINGETITLLSLPYGFDTFIAPNKTVTISGEGKAHIVRCFNHAVTAALGGGETILPLTQKEKQTNTLTLRHNIWRRLPQGRAKTQPHLRNT